MRELRFGIVVGGDDVLDVILLPREKGEVGVRALIADEPLVGREMLVQDSGDALDFVDVAVDAGLDLLRVEICEPSEGFYQRVLMVRDISVWMRLCARHGGIFERWRWIAR